MEKIVRYLTHGYALASIVISLSSSLFAADAPQTKNDEPIAIIDTHAHVLRGYHPRTAFPTGANVLRAMDSYRVEKTILMPHRFRPIAPEAMVSTSFNHWCMPIRVISPLPPVVNH